MVYPLGTNYFTMYDKNCDKVGKLFFKKQRELIVSCYTLGKYFLDCIRTNNYCLDALEKETKEGIVGNAQQNLSHSFKNNILPTANKLQELFKYIK